MKAILMLDETPKSCVQCPCYRLFEVEEFEDCKALLRQLSEFERKNRPLWCPLIEINKNVAKLIEVAR